MATGDIVSVTVRADGWSADVVIAGFVDGAAYNFGLSATNAPTAATPYLTVVSEGYNSAGTLGTTTRTVYLTQVVRKAYPDEAENSTGAGTTKDETEAGGNLSVRVALSDFVYDDDNTGAGKSGTAPTATFPAAWATNSGAGGGSETSAAATAMAVTNSSTLDYPKAFGQWAMLPHQRFTADPTLRFTARHRFGIARVLFTLTDPSAHANTAAATTETTRQRSASGLYATEFAASVSLTGLDANSVLTGRAQLYPKVGDADSIFDTNAVTANDDNRVLGQCDYPFHNGTTVTKYVATTGNDTTGNGSAGTPWATIGKALTDGSANDIELAAGTYNVLGTGVTAPASLGHWRIVRPASGAAVILQLDGTKAYNTPHLMYQGVTVQLAAGSNRWFDGATGARYIAFENCAFDANGQSGGLVSALSYRSAAAFLHNCAVDDVNTWAIGNDFGARLAHWLDGCSLASATAAAVQGVMRQVACAMSNVLTRTKDGGGSTTAPQQNPFICEFNRIVRHGSTAAPAILAAISATISGVSIVGNLIEKTADTSAAIQLAADSSSTDVSHVLLWHNTVVGPNATAGRLNCAYNETGSTARNRLNWSIKYNIIHQFNNKDDTFAPANANRVGSWPVGYAVGSRGNRYEGSLFPGEFPGLDTIYTDTQAFTNDLTGSTGGGDYTLSATSTGRKRVPSAQAVLTYDLTGRAVPDNGNGSAGAYQYDEVAPTLSGYAVSADGLTVTATISEAGCTPTSGDNLMRFEIAVNGQSTSGTWAVSGTTWTATLNSPIHVGDAVLFSYSQIAGFPYFVDAAGNELGIIEAAEVTNNSEVVAASGGAAGTLSLGMSLGL